MSQELDGKRAEIAELDAQIIRLVGKRLRVAEEIGEIKRKNGLDIAVPAVEEQVRMRYAVLARECGVSDDAARKIADILIAEAKRVQQS